jgi:hypothetical protein
MTSAINSENSISSNVPPLETESDSNSRLEDDTSPGGQLQTYSKEFLVSIGRKVSDATQASSPRPAGIPYHLLNKSPKGQFTFSHCATSMTSTPDHASASSSSASGRRKRWVKKESK